jgi:hypothetical protein
MKVYIKFKTTTMMNKEETDETFFWGERVDFVFDAASSN